MTTPREWELTFRKDFGELCLPVESADGDVEMYVATESVIAFIKKEIEEAVKAREREISEAVWKVDFDENIKMRGRQYTMTRPDVYSLRDKILSIISKEV